MGNRGQEAPQVTDDRSERNQARRAALMQNTYQPQQGVGAQMATGALTNLFNAAAGGGNQPVQQPGLSGGQIMQPQMMAADDKFMNTGFGRAVSAVAPGWATALLNLIDS